MKTKNIGIGLLVVGSFLYLTSMNEKTLTPEEIQAGDDVSIKRASKTLLIAGAALIVFNLISKNQ